jgi:hypothetical protein
MNTQRMLFTGLIFAAAVSTAVADGPKDNLPDHVRPVPPVGVEVSAADQAELNGGLAKLDASITKLRASKDARLQRLLPDVEIFARAVRGGLEYRELYSPGDVVNAKRLLQEGQQRANDMLDGKSPWTTQEGLVVRGFRSKIDNTVQPYGLVIPQSYDFAGKNRYRLDLWFHGRGERSAETEFIAERMTNPGAYTPRDTIVLHPYGRYSNAFKFAGEVDVLEALDHARENYRVDDDRVSVRGFSMGGAGCWQMAVHYPDLFFAANPGAGFCETPQFLKVFQQETLHPTWYEEKLWRLYDCPGYAVNLYQLPTVAYSGELDIQKQAADVMECALDQNGLRLTHIIGPHTKHAIHPESMRIIETKMDQLAEQGRPRLPQRIRFATYTLKYNRLYWLTVTQLGEHWEQAAVDAELFPEENAVRLTVKNIEALRLAIPAGRSPFAPDRPVEVVIAMSQGDQTVTATRPGTDQSWDCEIHLDGDQWKLGSEAQQGLRKKHDLQGPIDDAFMDSFVIVAPTGRASQEYVGRWAAAEMDRMVRQWRHKLRVDDLI